ncbi:MAG: methyltransferase domain-containing protein [Silvibacterium sp.]|nr:methyltransferase domain-containing protein [Silvibacterium sp.]
MKIAPARDVAFQILLKITLTDAHSDELLRTRQVNALTPQDRALATTLVLGTLRWQMKLDVRIRPLLSRPDARLPPAVETALRLAAHQLLYLDRVPAYAAISDSVELTKQAGEAHAARMVNAVLRKLAGLPRIPENPDPQNTKDLADTFAHPLWLVQRWSRFYGLATARAICSFDQQPASTSIRLLDPDAERDLSEDGIQLDPGEFLTAARRVVSGDVVRSRVFREGRIRIQDEGSQLVAELAGSGSRIGARSRILDTCAAPGGKTAILAERNPRASITAWDISKRRLEAMKREFVPATNQITFEVRDATATELKPEYDLILCDVPCTGTGTIARNPEIRFRVSEDEIARQHARQVKILSASLAGLAPAGCLLYSTCSLEPEENEAVVAECLAANPGFTIQPLDQTVRSLVAAGILTEQGAEHIHASALKSGFLRTIPGLHNCDGFFAALLMRN